MTKTGYNLVACLALVCAVATTLMGEDKDLAMAMVVLAGTIVGRGSSEAV